MTFAPVDHFNDRVYDCRIDRPRQNGRSRCRADDDVALVDAYFGFSGVAAKQ